jgi:hypothetical protein
MRPRKAVALLPVMALVVLTSCSKKATPTTQGATTTTSTTTSSITTTAPASPCPFTADFVSPSTAPLINVQPPGGAAAAVTNQMPITCASVITVDQRGAANVVFGSTAACQLTQDNPGVKVAKVTTRDPAGVILRVGEGMVHCTFGGAQPPIDMCDIGTVLPAGTENNSVIATCDAEPVFDVQVFLGFFHIIDPAGNELDMGQGQEFSFDFDTGQGNPLTDAKFDPTDRGTFADLADFVKIG